MNRRSTDRLNDRVFLAWIEGWALYAYVIVLFALAYALPDEDNCERGDK